MKTIKKFNYKKQKGISLIVLVITIVVVIILAGAVLLSLSKNNPIKSANKAEFLNDIGAFKTELELYKSKEYTDKIGQYEPKKLFADEDSITYKDQNIEGDINTIIPSLGNKSKYDGEFEVIEGELWYKGNNKDRQDWSGEGNIPVTDGNLEVVVSTTQNLPVKSGVDVIYIVRFTSSKPITTVNLAGKVKLVDNEGTEISSQPIIEIGDVSGTSEDKSRTVELTIKTNTLAEGIYKVKVGKEVVQDSIGRTNKAEVVSSSTFEIDNEAPQMPVITTDPENLENWVSGIVKIIITPSESGNKLEYNLDGSSNYTEYTAPIEINENKTIYAKEIDKANNTSNIATLEITKIDNISPQNATINTSSTSGKITATITLLDNESGIEFGNSKYIVTTNGTILQPNSSEWNSATNLTSNPQTIEKTDLAEGDYYIQVLSVDKVGNKRVNVSEKVTFEIIHESKVVTYEKESENIAEVNASTMSYTDEDGFTGTLTGQGVTSRLVQTGGSYTPGGSKTATDSRSSSSNNLPSSLSYSDGQGYSGTLTGQGVTSSTVQTGGSYTPSQSKTVTFTNSSSTNSFPTYGIYGDSDGYSSNTIPKSGSSTSSTVQTGGSYTPAQNKTISSTNDGYNVSTTLSGSGGPYLSPGLSSVQSTYNYSDGSGYSGVLKYSVFIDNAQIYNQGNSVMDYNTLLQKIGSVGSTHIIQWYYSGTVTKPEVDTRTYSTTYYQTYSGTATKPAVDTRTYSTTYSQNYSGTVTKPAVDTRTYKTVYSQTYTGTVIK